MLAVCGIQVSLSLAPRYFTVQLAVCGLGGQISFQLFATKIAEEG